MFDSTSFPRHNRGGERGGVTIIAALMLLALLTVAVIGLSRNSMRETMVLAAARQSSDIREVADTGVEWSIQWMDPKVWPEESQKPASVANPVVKQVMELVQHPELAGRVYDIPSTTTAKMLLPERTGEISGISRTFDMQLSYMGRVPITDTSQMDPRLFPLLWMIRSRGTVALPGGLSFKHDRESWISTPIPEVR